MLAQHLGDGQHQVGGGNAFRQFSGELEAHHIRNKHGYRLAEHGGFRFNTADAPPQYPQTVDHSGMGIRTHQRVRIGDPLFILQFAPDGFTQIFKVYLVTNAGAWRDHAKPAERLLSPLQEDVALVVTLHLETNVFTKGIVITEVVNGHGVVNDEVNGGKRVNLCRISAETLHGFAHRG